MISYNPRFLPSPVALFFSSAFVIFFFTFYQGNFTFHQIVFPVKSECHASLASLIHFAMDFTDFFFMKQKLAHAGWFCNDMGASGTQRSNVRIQQPGFAVFEEYMGVGKLGLACPQTFYFPAGQRQASFKGILNVVIMSRSLVAGDRVAWLLAFFLGHGT